MFIYNIADILFASDTNNPVDFNAYSREIGQEDGAKYDLVHTCSFTDDIDPVGDIICDYPFFKVFRNEGVNRCYYYVQDAQGNTIPSHYNIVSPDQKEILTYRKTQNQVGSFSLIGTFYEFAACLLSFDAMVYHAAAVEHKGECVLFVAPSGVGKSTHARLWKRNFGSLIINGDTPAIRLRNGKPHVYGTPWCGSSGEHIERVVPLKAIVLLRQGTENRIQETTFDEHFGMLYPQVVFPRWDGAARIQAVRLFAKLLGEAKIYLLECTTDLEAAVITRTAIYGK